MPHATRFTRVGSPCEPSLSGSHTLRYRDGCCLLFVFHGTLNQCRRWRRRYVRTRRNDDRCAHLQRHGCAVCSRDVGRTVWRRVHGGRVRGWYLDLSYRNDRRESLRLLQFGADLQPRRGRRRMWIRNRHADLRRWPVELPGRHGALRPVCLRALRGRGNRRRRRLSLKVEPA